jgi:hypothetical protein
MMVFVAEESKPGTVEKKPKHMNSNRCHQFWRMTVTVTINLLLKESWSTPHLRVLNPVKKGQDARIHIQRHYL